jgi:hypothetical protein
VKFSSAASAEHAFVEGYELVAFDILPSTPDKERIMGWEVWPPKNKGLVSPDEYIRRLRELMDDNDAFDGVLEKLNDDRSVLVRA